MLVRLHFVVHARAGETVPEVDAADLEHRLAEATRSWSDDFAEALVTQAGEEAAARLGRAYADAFPAAYKEDFPARVAVADLRRVDALEPAGLMAAAVARHVGARFVVVTDVNEARLELARKMGVDLAVNVSDERISAAQRRLGMAESFDVGLEMSGSPAALPELLDNLNHGARVAVLGLPSQAITIDWAKVVTHMITIKGIYGREIFETWYAMTAMVSTGLDISPVITDRFPASRWADAFGTARNGDHGKIIIDWSEGRPPCTAPCRMSLLGRRCVSSGGR